MKPINSPVFGYSPSATIASLKADELQGGDLSQSDQTRFVTVGNESRPSGGIFSHFPGQTIPSVDPGIPEPGPSGGYNSGDVATFQFDDIADFPQYSLNLLGDLNALLGANFLHASNDSFQINEPALQPSNGDTVTISPEAQVAADVLAPTE